MTPDDVATDTGGGADVVITDQQLYDHATAKEPVAEPAPAQDREPAQAEPAPQQPAQGQRQRDDQGRFVAGQAPQQSAQGVQPPAAPQQPQQRTPEDHRVPLRELLDERERRQRIEAEANQMRQAWAQFQAMQQQQAAQQQQPTIFDNPDQYLAQRDQALWQQWEHRQRQEKDMMSLEFAKAQFGQSAQQEINAALTDLKRIRETPQGNVLYWQIMDSGHPYGSLIAWHRHARAQAEIGPDPRAWQQKQRQQLLDDDAFQAEAAKRYYAKQQQQRQANGRPPPVNLPPSLSSLPASSGRIDEQGDLSDSSLYRFATKR